MSARRFSPALAPISVSRIGRAAAAAMCRSPPISTAPRPGSLVCGGRSSQGRIAARCCASTWRMAAQAAAAPGPGLAVPPTEG